MIRRISMLSTVSAGCASLIVSTLLLRQAPECGHLTEILFHAGGWNSEMAFARRNIVHHTRFRAKPCASANLEMTGDAALRGQHDILAELGGAGDTGLGDDDTATPHGHVVPDLHQII